MTGKFFQKDNAVHTVQRFLRSQKNSDRIIQSPKSHLFMDETALHLSLHLIDCLLFLICKSLWMKVAAK